MKRKNKLLLLLLCTAAVTMQAKVRLPHLIADNMIVQHDTDVRLWGWDKPGSKIKAAVSWSSQTATATAAKDGTWQLTVRTPQAGYTPLSVTFDDGEKTTVSGILSGEVWVCAGQSNMEIPVKGFPNCPVEGSQEIVATAAKWKNKIHYCKVPSVMSMKPLDDAQCWWKPTDISTVMEQSAVGFFFARMLNQALDVPVGLIEANKGGSRVESWLSRDYLKAHTDEPLDSQAIVKKYSWDYHRPLLWGNGTFHPILNYTVKGILYYQGCSNVDYPSGDYANRLAELAREWRTAFGEGNIPFYIVQIAPFTYGGGKDGTVAAYLREQQQKASEIIPNSDIVCTNDCVYPWESGQIHPTQKKPVGERLAFIALNHDYGFKDIRCESASFKSMEIKGDTCYIRLKNDYGGISRFENIEGFEVAGADRVFHKAVAGHFWVPGNDPRNESIFVTSSEVSKPVAVRYCFKNFQIGNLGNNAQLPVLPFRTDDWPMK